MNSNAVQSDRVVYLRGKKTILRPPRESTDLELFLAWFNDPDARSFVSTTDPVSEIAEREWFKKQTERQDTRVFTLETLDGRIIGTMGAHGINWVHRTCTTGAYIGAKDLWGKGYGTDAKMVLLKWLFDTLGMYKVCSQVIDYNKRSLAYSLKCGYRVEGRLRKHMYRDGKRHDLVQLAVFRPQFMKVWQRYNTEEAL